MKRKQGKKMSVDIPFATFQLHICTILYFMYKVICSSKSNIILLLLTFDPYVNVKMILCFFHYEGMLSMLHVVRTCISTGHIGSRSSFILYWIYISKIVQTPFFSFDEMFIYRFSLNLISLKDVWHLWPAPANQGTSCKGQVSHFTCTVCGIILAFQGLFTILCGGQPENFGCMIHMWPLTSDLLLQSREQVTKYKCLILPVQ